MCLQTLNTEVKTNDLVFRYETLFQTPRHSLSKFQYCFLFNMSAKFHRNQELVMRDYSVGYGFIIYIYMIKKKNLSGYAIDGFHL